MIEGYKTESYKITTLKRNTTLQGQYEILPNVAYSDDGRDGQTLTLIEPWALTSTEERIVPPEPRPLIVFVQGSAWTTPNVFYQLPQLVRFAKEGFVVASVVHRNCLEGYPAPAFLEDVKCAIRFLRKNAAQFAIDGERVAIWGTSSGGNSALLVGLTEDEDEYKTDEWHEFSDAVKLVVACFAPTDLPELIEHDFAQIEDGDAIVTALLGDDRSAWKEKAKRLSPLHLVKEGKSYPPFMLLHGTKDDLVSYQRHFLPMCRRLADVGACLEAVAVEGAGHEGSFWSEGVYDTILEFIRRHI